MGKFIQTFFFFFYLSFIVVFATQQISEKYKFFSHPKAREVRSKIMGNWYRKGKIKKVFPLELIELMGKYAIGDKIDLTFLFNNVVTDVNNQIKIINDDNSIFQLVMFNKVNTFHDFYMLCIYLADFRKINCRGVFLRISQPDKYISYSQYKVNVLSLYKDPRFIIFKDINKKIVGLNEMIYQNEQIYKAKSVRKSYFCVCM